MSTSLQEDLEYANLVLSNKYDYSHFKLYANTNESMKEMFGNLNITGKRVLTVMSSCDYLIMSHLFAARSVECFDINPLTYRYFFLRRWLIQNGVLEYGYCNYDRLIEIVNSISSFSSEYERESNIFWKEMLGKLSYYTYYDSGFITAKYDTLHWFYKDNREKIIKLFSTLDPVFYNVNLSEQSGLGIDKKYDYVFISNILDMRNNRSPERLEAVKKNLLNVLESDGRIVLTHFPGRFGGPDKISETLEPERKVFDKEFDFQIVDDSSIDDRNIAYMYTRR